MPNDPRSGIQVHAARVLVAESDEAVRSAWAEQFAARCAPVTVLMAGDAATAVEVLLDERPSLIIVSLRLPEGAMANPQGGFQVILDAADLGVPSVLVSGPLEAPLLRRLDQLGVLWVRRDDAERDVVAAVDQVLRRYGPTLTSARQAAPSRSARSAIAS